MALAVSPRHSFAVYVIQAEKGSEREHDTAHVYIEWCHEYLLGLSRFRQLADRHWMDDAKRPSHCSHTGELLPIPIRDTIIPPTTISAYPVVHLVSSSFYRPYIAAITATVHAILELTSHWLLYNSIQRCPSRLGGWRHAAAGLVCPACCGSVAPGQCSGHGSNAGACLQQLLWTHRDAPRAQPQHRHLIHAVDRPSTAAAAAASTAAASAGAASAACGVAGKQCALPLRLRMALRLGLVAPSVPATAAPASAAPPVPATAPAARAAAAPAPAGWRLSSLGLRAWSGLLLGCSTARHAAAQPAA
jgi:hypothetical protein